MKWCLNLGDLEGFHPSKSSSDSLRFCHVLEAAFKSSHDLENLVCSFVDVKGAYW